MTWTEITVIVDPEPADWSPYIDVLADYGCENSLQQDKPPSVITCLADVPGADAMLEEMKSRLEAMGATQVAFRQAPDVDWSEVWKAHFKPRRVGKRFVIKPTWEEWRAEAGDLVIELDPGQAFGTGEHPTTRGCLELMESIAFDGAAVADIGCGSGVLSIGAVLLGAKSVVGVDIEPVSVEVAKLNAEANGQAIAFIAGKGFDALPSASYDVVISNIVSATLIGLSRHVAERLNPGGYWLVSGILEPNWGDVKDAANRVGFRLEREILEDQWVSAIFRR